MVEEKNTNGKNGEIKNGALEKILRKFLFVSWESLSGDLAWQIKKEGHEVKIFIKSADDQDVYDGFLEKVDDWKSHIDWADVIVFDDIGFGSQADSLRKAGKSVVGGSNYTDKLEEDREFGQSEMKRLGLLTLPHWDFTDYDAALKFIEDNPGRYIYKPSGSVASDWKSLLFLGKEEDGKDLHEIIRSNKKMLEKKIKQFQLQKLASGVEIAVGAFFNGEDFIYPINVNFEHKKLFPGDIGPFTGEMGCYDDQTEVLTKNGWKYFKDLEYKDEIATLNPNNNYLEYHKPSRIVSYNHHDNMIQIKNRSIDILVTPNHKMWVQKRYKKEWEFISAKTQLNNPPRIARTAHWKGKKCDINKASFLGIYLAEGCVSRAGIGHHQVFIAGTNPKKINKIKIILKNTKLLWKRSKSGWCVYNKKLHGELFPFGKSYEKFVPNEIKKADQGAIRAFLDAYALGDATIMPGGWRIFYTSSQRMADDIQELLLKLNRVGIIKERNRFGKRIWIKDHFTQQKHRAFEVIERIHKKYSYLDKRDTKIIPYKGKVYCATVPSHILYVRRNGKSYWCGNTLMYWSSPNTIFKSTLEKMRGDLKNSGYVGYMDINCIANARGIYPLEFTARFGYPTISIQMEGITNEMGEFLHATANRQPYELKTKKGFQVGVVCVVPPFPYDDKSEIEIYHDLSILFKKPNLEGVHLGDVKLIEDNWRIAGQTGYALVVTGSGTTVEDARKQAYSRIDNIMLQNMFYRTDIGFRWSEDSDKLQTWGYLY